MRQATRARGAALAALCALSVAVVTASASSGATSPLSKVKHIVVIYEENHSFDNLYGGWEGVAGLQNADAGHTTQVDQAGAPYTCLKQNDVNLAALPATCTDAAHGISSAFTNKWFTIDSLIPPTATTCPPPLKAFSFPNGVQNGQGLPGGCTRDLVHKFYQEQYQLNGGAQNRYMVGSDAMGLTMGVYDTKQLPIYKWLHSKKHPGYAIADNFFQAAFGGSFLNHQYLIAARAPEDPAAPATLHSQVDSAGFPRNNYPLYTPLPGATYKDSDFTVTCPAPKAGLACGNFAVNTMQPSNEPSGTFGEKLVLQTHATIGDRLTAKGVDWAWYAGGWADAAGLTTDPGYTNGAGPNCTNPNRDPSPKFVYPNCPDNVFQYHHQPFNYFANYAVGTPGRAHLQDEKDFLNLLDASRKPKQCALKPVSFWKPIGEENEHPGYASTPAGNSKLTHVLQFLEGGSCAKDTLVIVTYDEFGGQWDHVSPPGLGNANGPHDLFGPGTRIPALLFAPGLKGSFVVDSKEHDTTSILATIEHRYGLAPLSTRDAAASDLASVWSGKVVKQ
ncbi:MAG TPA: alkaline phosphatase family protein [Gaiellaceae bacterium]|nr:alkaline phosphatase family protein [Gaiellaceae bacterium]